MPLAEPEQDDHANDAYSYQPLLDQLHDNIILHGMDKIIQAETVRFTTKGQVVIPQRLRKQYHIENGTRAIVTATEEGILLKPVTRHAINRLRGILKRKPGDKPFAEERAEHKRQEKELEEAKNARGTRAR